MCKSLQATDAMFFSQVLFYIDHTLQIYWRSCYNAADRESVNDKILLMQEKQDLIIQHNFTYCLPKMIQDKLIGSLDTTPDNDNMNKYKNRGKGDHKQDNKNQIKSLKDIVSDPDPSHIRWCAKKK